MKKNISLNKVDFDNYVYVIFSLYKVKQNTIMKTCLFHNTDFKNFNTFRFLFQKL
jgi:hypothetical protein